MASIDVHLYADFEAIVDTLTTPKVFYIASGSNVVSALAMAVEGIVTLGIAGSATYTTVSNFTTDFVTSVQISRIPSIY